mmetsp:Transcript_26197/g.83196  ORF Transcript_26197/g.83196 Transcript_26197/m.83196 type:complete len:406 (-) Transcript_26197:10-1227(-)
MPPAQSPASKKRALSKKTSADWRDNKRKEDPDFDKKEAEKAKARRAEKKRKREEAAAAAAAADADTLAAAEALAGAAAGEQQQHSPAPAAAAPAAALPAAASPAAARSPQRAVPAATSAAAAPRVAASPAATQPPRQASPAAGRAKDIPACERLWEELSSADQAAAGQLGFEQWRWDAVARSLHRDVAALDMEYKLEGGLHLDEIHEILGIRQCSPLEMSDTQRADGLPKESLQPCFLVRGQFERNAPYEFEEPVFRDTRWVGFEDTFGLAIDYDADAPEFVDEGDRDEFTAALKEYNDASQRMLRAARERAVTSAAHYLAEDNARVVTAAAQVPVAATGAAAAGAASATGAMSAAGAAPAAAATVDGSPSGRKRPAEASRGSGSGSGRRMSPRQNRYLHANQRN